MALFRTLPPPTYDLLPTLMVEVCLVLAPDVNFFLNSRKLGLPCWCSLSFFLLVEEKYSSQSVVFHCERKENYERGWTPPASIKERETHWSEVPYVKPPSERETRSSPGKSRPKFHTRAGAKNQTTPTHWSRSRARSPGPSPSQPDQEEEHILAEKSNLGRHQPSHVQKLKTHPSDFEVLLHTPQHRPPTAYGARWSPHTHRTLSLWTCNSLHSWLAYTSFGNEKYSQISGIHHQTFCTVNACAVCRTDEYNVRQVLYCAKEVGTLTAYWAHCKIHSRPPGGAWSDKPLV